VNFDLVNFLLTALTIDPIVAIDILRRHRKPLQDLIIRHCLPHVAASLYAKYIIPKHVYEMVCNKYLGRTERCEALLDWVVTRIQAVPKDFITFVDILKAEPYLKSLGYDLIHSYRE
jgi:hypothetical protein